MVAREKSANDQLEIGEHPGPIPTASETGPVPSHAASGPVPTGKVDPGHLENRLVVAGGDGLDPMSLGLRVMTEPLGWIAAGCDLDADIVPTVAGLCIGRAGDRIKSWNYFAKAVARARDRRLARGAIEHVPPDEPKAAAASRKPRQKSVGDRLADAMARVARGEEAFPSHNERTPDVVALHR